MEFFSFDTVMQAAADRRTRLLEQAGNELRPARRDLARRRMPPWRRFGSLRRP
jgi:hypothetical protein